MAYKQIELHNEFGDKDYAYVGYSWTTLFFGPLPALLRGDYYAFFLFLFLILLTTPAVSIIISFFYNEWHLNRLLNNGYYVIKETNI